MPIGIKNICKSYGDKQVLKDFNLYLYQGEITCLMGKSGVGKSTLVNIIAGLTKADSGEIEGINRLSVVFQEDRLFTWGTAMANILFAAGRNKTDRAKSLLRKSGLQDVADKEVGLLSGGMRRRVSICRGLAKTYDLLVLDEPFKGLDEDAKLAMINILKDECARKATVYILCITHDIRDVELLDGRLVTME